ncbi:hypothetical protein KI387_001612 [Taxus chinensis]|uniref:Smr domain-containing protein n=1 Tax=Taxus chinensis TaxID=29808 RepID=A0AA38GUU9_TAXCH|nr:hypothetical protein KI387_001612 [Taxus chinensis]
MGSRKDVPVSKRSALNPNAPEFIPSAFRSAHANISVVKKPGSAKYSSLAGTSTNNSSNSISYNDQNEQYWQSLLPDDITPEYDNLEDDAMGAQSHEDENKVDPIEFLVKRFPNFSEESLTHIYVACGGDLNFAVESLDELELQDYSDPQWERNMHSASGHTMDPNLGSNRSVQVPRNFTLDRMVVDGNRLQTSSIPQRMHQKPSQVAINAGENLGTACLSSNFGDPTRDISAQNAYFEQARKTIFPARELIAEGKWDDAEMGLAPCRELIYTQRNTTTPQLRTVNLQHANDINLQGCDPEEAIQILKLNIADRRYTSWQTGQHQLISIDVGSGQAIHGSSAAARLPLAVERYLVEEEKLQFSKEQSGVLKVLIN